MLGNDDNKQDDTDIKMDDNDTNDTDNLKSEQYREIMYNALCRISDKNPKIVLEKFINPITKYLGFDGDIKMNTNRNKDEDINSLKVLIDCFAPLCLQNEYIWHYVLQIIIDPLYSYLLHNFIKKYSAE